MSILIGYGKTKTKQEDNSTYITGFFTEEFSKLCPQFKDMLFVMKYIPAEKRRSEKSPHWAVELFYPQDEKKQTEEPEIPFE